MTNWLAAVADANWDFADVRQTFASASHAGKYVIFNIAHNEARIETIVNYADKRVLVMDVMTHKDTIRRSTNDCTRKI
ncbi:MAG: type II toxin-antitoxin system HigB family toxin [Candidatus Acidiferrales bacterium]